MRSCQATALLLLGCCGCVARTRAQDEVEGEDAQVIAAVFPDNGLSVANGVNDM